MESFFAFLKREELYRTKYRSENEFKAAVDNYIIFYNERRPHAKNGYKTPRKKEEDFLINTRLCRIRVNRQRGSDTVLFLFSVSVLNFFDFSVYIKTERAIAESLYL